MLRFISFFFYFLFNDIVFFFLILSFLGFFHASLVAMNQVDMKKVIAYSSISHMNFSLFGLFNNSVISMIGFLYLMFAHAFTASSLFFSIGFIYDRYKTRLILYYNSLSLIMPLYSIFFFFFY
jgi:NADH:ubiquinone oxidoreductase subunit 4 (subunit M)